MATAGHASEPRGFAEWLDRHCGPVMVLPAVIVILAFALFPLIISAYLAMSRFALAPGGFTLRFIGLANFRKLLTGSQQYHLLGAFGSLGVLQWTLIILVGALLLYLLYRYFTGGEVSIMGTLPIRGRERAVSGTIDRLAVTADEVLIADYKTNRPPPLSLDEVPEAYVVQMALYAALLKPLYPGRKVSAALLFTEAPRLLAVPAEAMEAALARLTRP